MGTELETAPASEELLERYARLSLERDELAARVAELERELASHRPPADAPRRSRCRNTLLWLAVVLSSTITLGAVVATAAILAGFWDPLGNDATPRSLAVPALPPPLVEPSPAEPQPAPARAPSPSPPAAATRLPETLPPATARTEIEIVAARGDSWLQVRRGSASGPVVYEGVLERGRSASFAARRLWFRFAVGDHLDVTVNGKRATGLPSLAGNAAVRSDGVRVLGVG
jgi:Domain of unknown function (DUF4115)